MNQPSLNTNFPVDSWRPFPSWIRVEEENEEQTDFLEALKKERREKSKQEERDREKEQPKE